MSSEIYGTPPDYDFGLEFNYQLWTMGTTVQFANVPWNSDYRDVVEFASDAALRDYVVNQNGPVYEHMSYARVHAPIRVDIPFNAVYKYNYIRVSNPAMPISGSAVQVFYYFIQDVRYIAPNTTEIIVMLDVWQTFGRSVEFGNCYIERGHVGIANERSFDNYGRDYLTVPEGLDIGSEYLTVRADGVNIGSLSTEFGEPQPDGGMVDVLVVSTVSWSDSGGTVESPVLATAAGSEFEGLPNGAEIYLFRSVANFKAVMYYLSRYPWISQGIISITAVPNMGLNVETEMIQGPWGGNVERLLTSRQKNVLRTISRNFRDGLIPSRYSALKKFSTSPYTIVELTTYSGTPLILKPECMPSDDIEVVDIRNFAPPNPRISFVPYRYNNGGVSSSYTDRNGYINDGGEWLDMQTGIFNLPTFAVVNNSAISYLASNSNSLAYQQQSADWSQQKALRGADLAYTNTSRANITARDQSRMGIDTVNRQNALNVETQGYRSLQSAINSGISGIGSMVSGNLGGGFASGMLGIANAGADYLISTNQMNQSTANANRQAQFNQDTNFATATFTNAANRGYAAYSANGDYYNTIAGIQAKVQDAKMLQPSTAGQVGGDAFNLTAMNKWCIYARIKMVDPAAIASIGEFWLRYGYAINRFSRVNSLQVMEKFTYWKLLETYITGAECPESYKQTIRGIFEKGVTVWRNPGDIGTIDIADNRPLTGITL